MKRILMMFNVLLVVGMVGCYDNPEDPSPGPGQQGTYKLKGFITFDGQPLEGAVIQVANALNWKTISGPDGQFLLEGLTKGEYLFRAEKSFNNSQIIAQQLNVILVNDVTDLGEIKLPRPLSLFEIDASQMQNSSLKIKWSRSLSEEFLEYKLFRKADQGLDDSNAELIYASTSVTDTEFTDINFRTGQTTFYRAYAYSAGQKSAGSNFQSVAVPEVNLISNPGFEITSDGTFPQDWFQVLSGTPTFNYFSVTPEQVRSGNNSLKVYYNDAQSNPPPGKHAWGGLMQTIPRNYLVEGREYTLSFWTKSVNGSFQVRVVRNSNLEDPVISYFVPAKSEWAEQKFTFRVDNSNYYELWIIARPDLAAGGITTGYIDDLKLLK